MQVLRSKSISEQRRTECLTLKDDGLEFDTEESKDGDQQHSRQHSDSSSSMMDESMLEEEDDFADAEEGVTISQDKQMKSVKDVIISDCQEERIALPC